MLSEYFDKLFNNTKIPFDVLIGVIWGAFLAIFIAVVVGGYFSKKIKGAPKRPFLSLVNVFAALTLAAFLTESELATSVFAASLFWIVGYILYGIICALSREKQKPQIGATILTELPVTPPPAAKPPREIPQTPAATAKSSVRLEHAISVTDKLLSKNLGKSDRSELEKLKNTLAVLQIKGTLTSGEADILNDNFNTLLKLMAKYNI